MSPPPAKQGPPEEAPAESAARKAPNQAKGSRSAGKRSYRVTWTRIGWSEASAPKSRHFQSLAGALNFAARLDSSERHPELSPCAWIRIDQRRVGPWTPWGSA
jgi:hypothetical protein